MDYREYISRTFIGDHPRITSLGILAVGEKTEYGTVMGKLTSSGELKPLDPAANDGTEVAETVIIDSVDATAEALTCIKLDHGECVDDGLIWPESISVDQKAKAITELKINGIFVN